MYGGHGQRAMAFYTVYPLFFFTFHVASPLSLLVLGYTVGCLQQISISNASDKTRGLG